MSAVFPRRARVSFSTILTYLAFVNGKLGYGAKAGAGQEVMSSENCRLPMADGRLMIAMYFLPIADCRDAVPTFGLRTPDLELASQPLTTRHCFSGNGHQQMLP
jgi:hypothetical protein